jgi:hypothetical protein
MKFENAASAALLYNIASWSASSRASLAFTFRLASPLRPSGIHAFGLAIWFTWLMLPSLAASWNRILSSRSGTDRTCLASRTRCRWPEDTVASLSVLVLTPT